MSVSILGGTSLSGCTIGLQPEDPYYADVSLLLHFDSLSPVLVNTSNLIDNGPLSLSADGIVVSGAYPQYDMTTFKWSPSSMAVNGSSYPIYNDSPYFTFGSGDFTAECWVYSANFQVGGTKFFMGKAARELSINTAVWGLGFTGGPGSWVQGALYASLISPSLTAYELFGTTVLTGSTWHHVALTRSGNTARLFLDGTVQATTTITEPLQTPVGAELAVGAYGPNGSVGFSGGWIDDLRITKNIARYTGPYSVPTAPFPNA